MHRDREELIITLHPFKKTEYTDEIHLWESRFDHGLYEYVDPNTCQSTEINEIQFKEKVYEFFRDICSEKNIMCGRSFVTPKVQYFIRLFLSNEQNVIFILKFNNEKINIIINIDRCKKSRVFLPQFIDLIL